jgi:hypothetical protein
VDGAGQSGGRLSAGAGGGLRDGHQSGRAIVGDDLGSATAGLLGVQRKDRGGRRSSHEGRRRASLTTTVEGLVAAVHSTISHGRADKGGGRKDGTLHYGR